MLVAPHSHIGTRIHHPRYRHSAQPQTTLISNAVLTSTMSAQVPDAALPDSAAPIPLSFPAILRNSGLQSRFAHLSESAAPKPKPAPKKLKSLRRSDNEGKRWIRRQENARFAGNAYVVQPGKADLHPPLPNARSTFPEPLPAYLTRDNKLLPSQPPMQDPKSTDCGRFSLSLKGMRRDLRKMGFRSRILVREIETEILCWLEGGVVLDPEGGIQTDILDAVGRPVGETGSVLELTRTPLQLVWRISDDPFARYVVHCTARYHNIVSFSKEVSNAAGDSQRLTYLLRPNVVHPGYHAASGLDTPPATDAELSSQHSDSEFASDFDGQSDFAMSTIEETPASRSPSPATDDAWSVVNGEDGANETIRDESSVLQHRMTRLSLRTRTTWEHVRSSSSPSRSPVRAPVRRPARPVPAAQRAALFYDFLFP
ncbi:unnamed protein product [Mycena citricolor]|uniref:Uncharacterized protein n=1 Tax=Mycena citricolor TaxID=2018698 RepID=A0AAD2HSS8_9AGAR|nr:unnamed protein product [Mycena citricolor]